MVIAGGEELAASDDNYAMSLIIGVGGIGKTTLARHVFDTNYEKFESSSFVSDINSIYISLRGSDSKHIIRLQNKLLSNLLGRENKIEIRDADFGISLIRRVLRIRKVLIVLDDVEHPDQIEMLVGSLDCLRSGSKIMITSRNKDLLEGYKIAYKLHEVEPLNKEESLELFTSIAFGQKNYDAVNEEYKHLVEGMAKGCGGVPLSISVLASSLFGRDLAEWEMIFRQTISSSADGVHMRLLKISYDSLEEKEKAIFLHIACFFVGMDKDYVATILEGCGFHAEIGIRNLIDRCLLKVNEEDNKLMMHHVIQDMAREIVRQESPLEPGKRSRLWRCEDALHVLLSTKMDAKAMEGLALEFRPSKDEISSSSSSSLVTIETNRFSSMKNLTLLKLHNVVLIGEYGDFPKYLRWLSLGGLSTPPEADFPMENLVTLELHKCTFNHALTGKKSLPLLQCLIISECHVLEITPDLSGVVKLETLIVEECSNLVEIHESIVELERLRTLSIKGCNKLVKPNTRVAQKLNSIEQTYFMNQLWSLRGYAL